MSSGFTPDNAKPNPTDSGIGSQDALVGALPVFDAMPSNSGRFDWGAEFVYEGGEVGIPAVLTVFDRIFPEGYITTVQWVKINVIDASLAEVSAGIPPAGYTFTVLLDGIASIFNQNVFQYPLDGQKPCRVVGSPGQRLSIDAKFPYAAEYTGIIVAVEITGQMLVINRQQPQNAALVQPQIRTQTDGG